MTYWNLFIRPTCMFTGSIINLLEENVWVKEDHNKRFTIHHYYAFVCQLSMGNQKFSNNFAFTSWHWWRKNRLYFFTSGKIPTIVCVVVNIFCRFLASSCPPSIKISKIIGIIVLYICIVLRIGSGRSIVISWTCVQFIWCNALRVSIDSKNHKDHFTFLMTTKKHFVDFACYLEDNYR